MASFLFKKRGGKVTAAAGILAAAFLLGACSNGTSSETEGTASSSTTSEDTAEFQPVTIEHAFGSTTIETKPERVATVAWSNHEVPLALGIVPVGMAKANWGDDDTDGIHPWTLEALEKLGADVSAVTLYDETDALDFEAIAADQPDVIFATYSGITAEDYEKLSQIAPTVAYPENPWNTSMEENIRLISKGLGMEAEGEKLLADIEAKVEAAFAKYPELAGKKVMVSSFGSEADLSKIGFYTTGDPRMGFLVEAGFDVPDTIEEMSETAENFWVEVSAEKPELFADVELIVNYGSDDPAENAKTLETLQANPLWSKIPAIKNGNVAFVGTGPVSAAISPSPLATPWVVDKYFAILSEAVAK
ncbi:MAG: iron-siderophore ABC transporter substrate-binding protein [Arcanobacterium sp.]|nr:iron-siderophore ABC transporter substrate-binding protein [Arcanobacterium sp.]